MQEGRRDSDKDKLEERKEETIQRIKEGMERGVKDGGNKEVKREEKND